MTDDVKKKTEADGTPWPIRMLNGLVWDNVPTRLGPDAMTLAVVLIQAQNWQYGRPVGYWIGQLAEMLGEVSSDGKASKNPRRTRAARDALIKDGWLTIVQPKNGDRTQAVYEMMEKPTPGKTVDGKHMTPYENAVGAAVTPGKTVASPPAKLLCHPRQNGSTSILSIHSPELSIQNPPNPPGGEIVDEAFSLNGSAAKKTPKPKATPAVVDHSAVPESLDTAEFRAAWADWQQHRREIRKPMTPTATRNQLRELTAMGPDRAVAAIRHSLAKGYLGCYEAQGTAAKPKRDIFAGLRASEEKARREGADYSDPTRVRTGKTSETIRAAMAKAAAARNGRPDDEATTD